MKLESPSPKDNLYQDFLKISQNMFDILQYAAFLITLKQFGESLYRRESETTIFKNAMLFAWRALNITYSQMAG